MKKYDLSNFLTRISKKFFDKWGRKKADIRTQMEREWGRNSECFLLHGAKFDFTQQEK